jgi:hypothetical protein
MLHGRRVVAMLGLVFVLASCNYYNAAVQAEQNGTTPWWCTSTESIPVTTGPAVGSVDFYAGVQKTPLTPQQCQLMSAQFDLAKGYVEQWPTAGAAEADGWRLATPYVPGMGTHHIRGGITPQMLADPAFDRLKPILDTAGLNASFDPLRPEVLQFDGNTPSAKLVGFDYYVRTSNGNPPAGFAGNIDWWHVHPWICFRTADAYMVGFNITDAACTSANGINVYMENYYMLHVWILDDMKFIPDVFAGMIPCIANNTAIHDPNHSCHTSRTGMGSMAMGMGM